MVDREKVRLMTELTVFHKENKDLFRTNDYYCFDYVLGQMFSAFARYTFCFVVVFAVFFMTNFRDFFYSEADSIENIKTIFIKSWKYYTTGLLVYLLITFAVYIFRYAKAKKGIQYYVMRLRRLGRKYYYSDRGNENRSTPYPKAPSNDLNQNSFTQR